jgi:hypothetical protein
MVAATRSIRLSWLLQLDAALLSVVTFVIVECISRVLVVYWRAVRWCRRSLVTIEARIIVGRCFAGHPPCTIVRPHASTTATTRVNCSVKKNQIFSIFRFDGLGTYEKIKATKTTKRTMATKATHLPQSSQVE